jgi:hypothetical protein
MLADSAFDRSILRATMSGIQFNSRVVRRCENRKEEAMSKIFYFNCVFTVVRELPAPIFRIAPAARRARLWP